MDTLGLIGTIGGWGLAIVLGIVALLPRKGSLENLRIDQLQEDLAAERTARQKLDDRIGALDEKLDFYRKRDLAWMRYVGSVQRAADDAELVLPELPTILRGGA